MTDLDYEEGLFDFNEEMQHNFAHKGKADDADMFAKVADMEAFEASLNGEQTEEEKKKNPSSKMPGESVEEYLRRKGHIREMIFVCRERRAAELGKLAPGTLEYSKAMKKFKDWAVQYTTKEFMKPENQDKFPEAVRLGLRWFLSLKTQFMEVVQRHMNIDIFGNQVVLAHDTWEALFNYRRFAHYAPLVHLVAQSGLKWDEGMRPAVVLLGAKSCGKSYLLDSISKQFFDGVFDDITHKTAMAATTGTDNDLKNCAMDEAPAWLFGGGTGPNAKEFAGSAAASVDKSKSTRKRVHTQTMTMEDGVRRLVDYYSSNIGTNLYASNVQVPTDSNPQMARLIPLTIDNIDPTNEDAIERLMMKLQEPELDELKKDLLEQRRLINFYLMLFELYIAMGVIQQVQMDAWVMYFQRYCDNMQECSFILSDPKKHLQITELARTATVNYAVQVGLFSEITYKERFLDYRDPNSDYVRFFDHARFFVDVVERHLVCTRAIAIYTFSLCREMWANHLRIIVLSSAHKMSVDEHPEMFDDSCFDKEKNKSDVQYIRDTGITVSNTSSINSEDSVETPFENDANVIDDYGAQYDYDSSKIAPDNEGNYVGAIPKKGAADYKHLTKEGVDVFFNKKSRRRETTPSDPVLSTSSIVDEESNQKVGESGPQVPSEIEQVEQQMADPKSEANRALQMFLIEYQDGDISRPIADANFIEIHGVHKNVNGACQRLAQEVKDGSRPSLDNLETMLRNMADTDIHVPKYVFEGMKVVRKEEKHTIKMVRIEHNTNRFDPKMTYGGGATRVYVSTHSILNNHSLNKAVIKSIRNLGFNNTIPGRFLINIPVDALRYPDDKEDKRVVTMYGVCRVVKVMPRTDAFVYVKPSTVTVDMLDILCSTRRGRASIEVSPSLLTCSHGIIVTCEPEITAAMQHAKLCGMPPGTPLFGTPVMLEGEAAKIRQEIPHLRNMKLYSYPQRKMNECRKRYYYQDGHTEELYDLRANLSTNVDITRSAKSGKLQVPDFGLVYAISKSSLGGVLNLIAPYQLRSKMGYTFEKIKSFYTDPQELENVLKQVGITAKDIDEYLLNPGSSTKRSKIGAYEHGNLAKLIRNQKSEADQKNMSSTTLQFGSLPSSHNQLERSQSITAVNDEDMPVDDEHVGPKSLFISRDITQMQQQLEMLILTDSRSGFEKSLKSKLSNNNNNNNDDDDEENDNANDNETELGDHKGTMGTRIFQFVEKIIDSDSRSDIRPPLRQNLRPKSNSPTRTSADSNSKPASPDREQQSLMLPPRERKTGGFMFSQFSHYPSNPMK